MRHDCSPRHSWARSISLGIICSALAISCSKNASHPATAGAGGDDGLGGAGGTGGGGTGGAPLTVGCGDSQPSPPAAAPAACTDTPTAASGAPSDVTLSVDASAAQGAWNRFYEGAVATDHANTLLCTYWNRNVAQALKKAHDQAGFRYARFHGILDDDIGLYSEDGAGAPVYDWTRFDAVYDTVVAAGMRPIVEIGFMPSALASDPTETLTALWYETKSPNTTPPKDWNRWQALMADIVTHLEARYGADEVRTNWYFEVWNEPSWMYTLGDNGYLMLYLSTVTGLLQGDPAIRVGGPAGSSGESPSMINNLIRFGQSSGTKVDFVTYHRYGDDPGGSIADATDMLTFHRQIAAIVKKDNFTGAVINDEFGPSYKADITRDNEVGASFIAKTIHLIGTDTMSAPPTAFGYWTVSDLYEEVDTGPTLAYREGNFGLMLKGDSHFPESFDVAKPSFNAFRLLHMMGDTRVSLTGGTTGDGVNGTATLLADDSAMQILVYNHTNGGAADSTLSSQVTVTVNNLPFPAGPVRVRQYIVDRTHANSYRAWVAMNRPAKPTQPQWIALRDAAALCYYETTVDSTSPGTVSVTFPQAVYGVSLIELHAP